MKYRFSLFLIILCVSGLVGIPFFVEAAFFRNLKKGTTGEDVRELQIILNRDPFTKITNEGPGSPGEETGYFGFLTEQAVIRFQEKYRSEVLSPAGLTQGSGFVGTLTRSKLMTLAVSGEKSTGVSGVVTPVKTIIAPTLPVVVSTTTKPEVFSVSPLRVRRGDVVTVTGKNFSRTGNMVELGDGPIYKRFENLSSVDGKTITFTYEPPEIKSVTKEELLALPTDVRTQIEQPLQKAGESIDVLLTPYKGIQTESQLIERLTKQGFSSDALYHHFFVIVKNDQGGFISKEPLVYGIHKLPFDTSAKNSVKDIFSSIKQGADRLIRNTVTVPVAHAQQYGGGVTSGMVMVCTCNGAVMTFQTDISGGGSGLYVYYPGFVPSAGSCRIAGLWLGGYIQSAGICAIYAGLTCVTITGNMPMLPIGCSM
jgi:peptidoglycan hydrolase-like protein with peptidoglycan-binding domain